MTGDLSGFRTPNCMVKLETERLILRSVLITDAERIFLIKSNPEVYKYQGYNMGGYLSFEHITQEFTYKYISNDIPKSSSYGFNKKRVLAITLKVYDSLNRISFYLLNLILDQRKIIH